MAFLDASKHRQANCVFKRACLRLLVAGLLLGGGAAAPAASPTVPEYQLKAVFLFNFTQFVEWPALAFSDDRTPFSIGVLGEDPFGTYLDEIVRGEKVKDRSLIVQRYRKVEDIKNCHVLFISRSEKDRLGPILAGLKGRSVLTVGDTDNFALGGGMIRFISEKNRIRMRINLDAAKAAGLSISSKLLRSAEIVSSGKD